MIAARWVLTIVLSLLWLVIAVTNGAFTWREWVRKEERVPSIVPVVGGFVAWLAATACPWDSPLVWLFFWLAVILDVGSLPCLVLALVVVLLEAREEKHFWKRTYMGSSWAVKFAVSVLGWLVFLPLIGTLGISLRQDEPAGEVALLVSSALYWILYTLVYLRLRKYRPKGGKG